MDRCICKRSAWTAIFGIIILTLLSSEAVSSSPPCIIKEIDETFGGLSDDWGYSIQQTGDGGYIIAGTTNSYGSGKSDIWLKKIDPEGKEIWNSTFGGTRDDEAYSVEEIDLGGFIVTGKTRSHGSGAYDAWLIRTDQNGNKVWDKTFGGPLDDEGFSVHETGDGGFIVAGRTRSKSGNGYYDVWLIKTDQYGNKIWDKTFGGPMDDVGDFVQQTNDGGYIIVGTTNSFGAGGSDVLLIKTDSEGNEIWDRIYGGPKSEQNPWSKGWSVLQNSEGGYMLVGSTDSFGAGGYDIWLIKTDKNGELISDRTYGGPFNDEGGSIIQLGDNEYILVGSTNSYGAGGYDAWLIKIDKNGNIIWDQTYGGVTDDKGYSVEKTDDEGYIFVGKKKSDHGLVPQTGGCCQADQPRIGANFDLWIIKTKSGSPTLKSQPQSITTCPEEEVSFKVEASGTEPLSFQWKKDGTEIAGAVSDIYSIPEVTASDSGSYSAIVSNDCGWIESDQASLIVYSRPSILTQPISQEVSEDSDLTLKVEAEGTEPLAYQWKKGEDEIPGANSNIFRIPSAVPDDAGSYSVIVSNACGLVESLLAVVTVNLKPIIQVQPIYEETCEGSEVKFNVEATGTEPLFYQWKRNGENISGANSDIYFIPEAAVGDAGSYSVAVSNCCGQIESIVANLTVKDKTAIKAHPASQIGCEGSEVTFAVEATGTEPLTYQWKKNGENITGANARTYTLQSIQKEDAGSYHVLVSSCCCGIAESNPADLTVNTKPAIQIQPASQVACEGSEVSFEIEATGTEPLSYQWIKDGAEIPGANSQSYSISNVTASDAGGYSAIISNCCGLAISEVASLKVESKPSIQVQPQDQVACDGAEIAFSIQASGSEPLSYQWRKDGAEIPGANATSLIIPGVSGDNAGRYSVAVSNSCGQVVSDEVSLEVNLKPNIVVQPQSQATCEGSEVVFSIQAAGTEPLSYQWRKDGTEIPGANATSLIIPGASSDSAGNYSAAVSNACGQVVSDEATLEVNLKPVIVVQPQSQAVCEGSEVAFNVQAAGTEPLSYQWRKDGTEIPGANAASLIVPGVSSESAGRYSVSVSNTCGQVVSDEATLEVDLKPNIVVQPQSQVTCEGAEVVFSIQATGTEPLNYQWRKDGTEIPGANAASLIIPGVSGDNAGRYGVVVSNSCGQVVSDEATLEVDLKPVIVVQPQSQATCEGSEVVFSIQATGTEPLSYQWRKDGADIPGANATSLIIPGASNDSTGRYSVAVSNSCGQVVSDEATLEVNLKPSIVVQPQSQVVCEGSEVAFSVQATGTEPLSYQWIKDGAEIPGANSDSYAISSATAAEVGSYSVAVSNCCGLSISNVATLAVNQIPSIIAQPEDQTVCAGSKASFSVVADGIEPLRYQWSKDDKIIEGANESSYEIPSADMGSTGSYSVAVSNSCGQAASNAAFLYVLVEPSILAQPESQTVCEGSEITFRVQAAGSEPLRYQWRKDGTEIPGAVESDYSISAVSLSDTGSYAVAVANDCGQIVSEAAVLDVITKPSIQVQPESQVVCEGSEVTFRVEATGSEPLAYQWKKDGADIEGANLSYYQILCVAAADTGIYSVVVSDRCGQAESDPAFLTVGSKPAIKTQPVVETPPVFCCKPDKDIQPAANARPAIVVQPSSQVVCEGSIAKLSAECEGLRPMSLQWKRDGVAIPGANSNKYAIFNAALEDEGRYSVVATNCYGSSESCPAELRVICPPIVIALPECQVANVGAAASFTARTRGTGPISYQWKKDGVAIPGAVFATYSIACVGPGDAGCYQVVAANGCCLSESNEITLKVPKAVPNSCRPKQPM